MRAGELDRSIVIQAKTSTQDASGQPIDAWAKIHSAATIPAKVTPNRGDERFAAQQVIGRAVVTFKIRYRAGVTKMNRVVYAGKNWDIHDVRELGRREALEIDASSTA